MSSGLSSEDYKFSPIKVAESHQFSRWLDRVQATGNGDYAEAIVFQAYSVSDLAKAVYNGLLDEFRKPEHRRLYIAPKGVEIPTQLRQNLLSPVAIFKA